MLRLTKYNVKVNFYSLIYHETVIISLISFPNFNLRKSFKEIQNLSCCFGSVYRRQCSQETCKRGRSDKYLASPPDGATMARDIHCRFITFSYLVTVSRSGFIFFRPTLRTSVKSICRRVKEVGALMGPMYGADVWRKYTLFNRNFQRNFSSRLSVYRTPHV